MDSTTTHEASAPTFYTGRVTHAATSVNTLSIPSHWPNSIPELAEAMAGELARERDTLEMIASRELRPARGAAGAGQRAHQQVRRGLPRPPLLRRLRARRRRRVRSPIDRAKALFGAEFANVQPHSGAQANAAVLMALIARRATSILGLDLAHGGHLTHGMKLNFSGKLYDVVAYGVEPGDAPRRHGRGARKSRSSTSRRSSSPAGRRTRATTTSPRSARSPTRSAPTCGSTWRTSPASSPRAAPVARAATPTSSPRPCTRRSAARARASSSPTQECAKKLNSAVFPGQQGGPLMHVIAAKAVALKIAATEEFKDRQAAHPAGAQILAERLTGDDVADAGVAVLTGGTDVHLVLVDLRNSAARRPAGRGPAARGRHHRQPQRGAVRPAPADGHLGPAHRHRRRSPPAASATPSSPRSPTSSRTALARRLRHDVAALRARVSEARRRLPAVRGPRGCWLVTICERARRTSQHWSAPRRRCSSCEVPTGPAKCARRAPVPRAGVTAVNHMFTDTRGACSRRRRWQYLGNCRQRGSCLYGRS